uniref:Tr-type G domain-containing protein n=1 Tax=Brassica oleracea var. oleracea TaxID=109376 RepID=A0A0D3BJG4_BRAOL
MIDVKKKTLVRRNDVRNIAIVAHVDHGKTTLVDSMLRQAKARSKFSVGARALQRLMRFKIFSSLICSVVVWDGSRLSIFSKLELCDSSWVVGKLKPFMCFLITELC